MSKLDLLKLMETFDGEINVADFTPDELKDLLDRLETEGDVPLTKEEFKKRYFEFYDDVKDKSLKRQDW